MPLLPKQAEDGTVDPKDQENGVCCARNLTFCSSYGDGSDSNSRGGGKI